jgi:hypothetical protein
LFLSLSAAAQPRVFHAGFLGGITMSQVLNDGLSHYSKLGFYGGVFISTDFTDTFLGEVGMSYVMKGSKENQTNNQAFNGYKLTLGYIEFPILVKYRWKSFQFEIGPSLGILVNSNEKNLYQNDIQSITPFETFELAGIIGVNYSFTDKWGLDLRMSNSLIPIRYPTENVYYTYNQAQYNNVLSLCVRYFIR